MTTTAELTRTFTVAQLEALDLPGASSTGAYITEDHYSDHRWYTVHRVIFRDPADGTTWSLLRADPATEHQENDWWDRYAGPDAIVCVRVVPREVTVTQWFDATEVDLQTPPPAGPDTWTTPDGTVLDLTRQVFDRDGDPWTLLKVAPLTMTMVDGDRSDRTLPYLFKDLGPLTNEGKEL